MHCSRIAEVLGNLEDEKRPDDTHRTQPLCLNLKKAALRNWNRENFQIRADHKRIHLQRMVPRIGWIHIWRRLENGGKPSSWFRVFTLEKSPFPRCAEIDWIPIENPWRSRASLMLLNFHRIKSEFNHHLLFSKCASSGSQNF